MDRYTHQYAGDEAAALEVLPDLSAPVEAAEATENDDIYLTPDSSPTSSRAKRRVSGAARRNEKGPAARPRSSEPDTHNSSENKDITRAVATRRDEMRNGGGGIRTPETLPRLTVFKTVAFSRSATPPVCDVVTVGR